MAQTLSTLMQAAIAKMGKRYVLLSTATTGSSATQVVDTKLGTNYENDDLNDFTLIVTKTHDGLTPEGKITSITDYTAATWTALIDTVTDAIAAGDEYMIIKNIPKAVLIQKANDALSSLGLMHYVDDTTTTVATHLEYDLPVTLKIKTPLKIEYQRTTTDADANDWVTVPKNTWTYKPAAGGTVGRLNFNAAFPAGHVLRIHYMGYHPTLTIFSSVVDERIPLELVACKMACDLFAWVGITDTNRDEANYCLEQWTRAQQLFTIERPQKQARYLTYSRAEEDDGIPAPPTP